MKPKSFMVIAGEASGDMLAAELVHALRQEFARGRGDPDDRITSRCTRAWSRASSAPAGRAWPPREWTWPLT